MVNWKDLKWEIEYFFDCIKVLITEREWWWYFPFERCEWCGRWNYDERIHCWHCSWKLGDQKHD